MHKSSLFSTPAALLALAVLTIAAAYFGATLLCALMLLLLLIALSSRLWSRSVLKKATASLDEGQTACHVDETLPLTLRVRNRSFFPLVWLDVVVPLGRRLSLHPEEEETHKPFDFLSDPPAYVLQERFVWLMWQQEIACTRQLAACRRGVIPIERISLQVGDCLGMAACQRWVVLPRPMQLIVYPRLIPVDVQPFLRLVCDTETGPRGQMEDVTLLKSSRPYQHGDPMKRINWRYLAISGRMEVNQYETITPGCITFFLDLFSFREAEEIYNALNNTTDLRYKPREHALERMISLIASCIQAFADRGLRFALIIPGYADREPVICRPGSGETALDQAMEALAGVDYNAEDVVLPADDIRRLRRKLGVIHLCAWSSIPTQRDALEALGCGRMRCIACVNADEEPPAGALECTLADALSPDVPQEGGQP